MFRTGEELAASFLARRVAGGREKVREKEEELESYLWLVLARREMAGVGLSAVRGGRRWLCSATAALWWPWKDEVGPRSVIGRW